MLIAIIRTLSFLKPGADDDTIDRMNYYYTATFLMILALLVSYKVFGGRPLECWLPAEFKGSWEHYSAFSLLQPHFDDDIVDRINYYYTKMFLILLSMLVSFHVFYGRPIECWGSAEFKPSWTRYGEWSFCNVECLVDRLHSFYTVIALIFLSFCTAFKIFTCRPLECLAPTEFRPSWIDYAEAMLKEILKTVSFLNPSLEDDVIDRMNFLYTTTFLIVLSLLVSFKMLAGRPLECWLPAEFKNNWEQYAEMYCWAQSTYWVPFDEEIPQDVAEREYRYVSYYQWVPFFLLIEAMSFYLPCLFWRLFNDKSGVRMHDIIAIARDPHNIQPDTRRKHLKALALHLESVFRHQFKIASKHMTMHRFLKCLNLRYYEAYMSTLYTIIKLLYLVNVVGQLFLMNLFLQTDDYNIYGVGVLKDLLSGRPWESSGNFPRVTLCDMQIRTLANVNRYTVQCVLVINIFTEKIFILLWLWYTILTLATLTNLIFWLTVSFIPSERVRFVARHLELADSTFSSVERRRELKEFALDFIKIDGCFVLRMLTMHAGVMFTAELVEYLWKLHNKQDLDTSSSEEDDVCGPLSPHCDVYASAETLSASGGRLSRHPDTVSPTIRDRDDHLLTIMPDRGGSSRRNSGLKRTGSVFVPLVLPKPHHHHARAQRLSSNVSSTSNRSQARDRTASFRE